MPRTSRPRRTRVTLVRFTPDELIAARTRAATVGRPLAVFLRDVALRAAPKARAGHDSDELLRQLSRTAMALQTLSRDTAVAASADPRLADVLNETLTLIHRVAIPSERHV